MLYLQAAADLRTYDADPSCASGIAAAPATSGGCGVGVVAVGGGRRVAGGYALSLKFPDGARRDVPVSATGARYLRTPGTLAFVQVRRGRITLVGDERHVERTAFHPENRIAAARRAASVALVAAFGASVAAGVSRRRDGFARRANGRT